MTRGRVGLVLGVAAVLLAGCGSDPAGVRRQHVAEVTAAANDRDADRVRERAQALVDLLAEQREQGDLQAAEADRLTVLAQAVQRSADVVDAELLERARLEADRKKLEEERKRLEEERRKAEEDAKKRAEEEREKDEGEGEGKGEGDKKKDEDKDDD